MIDSKLGMGGGEEVKGGGPLEEGGLEVIVPVGYIKGVLQMVLEVRGGEAGVGGREGA